MSDETRVTQKAAIGSDTTQIATQNNYYGLSAKEATKMAIDMFLENFPKLQEEAAKTARERADELINEVIIQLNEKGKVDFSEFSDPDMQYVLLKSQQEYARFGTPELLKILTDLLINRINYNEDQYLKLLLDEALDVAKSLTPTHLDYLSHVFFCKNLKLKGIKTIDDLKKHLEYISLQCPIPKETKKTVPFLNMMRLLLIDLDTPEHRYSITYSLPEKLIKEIMPDSQKEIHPDYGLSPLGILIAIINLENKTKYRFDKKIWLTNI